jgi:hypothetical protein
MDSCRHMMTNVEEVVGGRSETPSTGWSAGQSSPESTKKRRSAESQESQQRHTQLHNKSTKKKNNQPLTGLGF